MSVAWVGPEDPLASRVRALTTQRTGGVSAGRYASLNPAAHVGDDPAAVAGNRARLAQALALPGEPRWLHQVHGVTVADFDALRADEMPTADGAVAHRPGVVLALLTADCLPVFLAARDGSAVGIAHAGWRGLAAGVLEATLATLALSAGRVVAWLGPAIGAAHYEVGEDVRAAFAGAPGEKQAFASSLHAGHWHCDLAALARARLASAGVCDIAGGNFDTYGDPERFYSYRRDGETGRMASLIWLANR